MKNSHIALGLIVFILALAGFMYWNNQNSKWTPDTSSSASSATSSSGDFQKVVLSFKNYNYYPNTITVKVNEPVRIYLDSSIGGCYRSFTIKELGISKYLATPTDYVEFTPKETGTYRFACSMGMGYGSLVVE